MVSGRLGSLRRAMTVVVVSIALVASTSPAVAAGSWSPTGSLTVGRSQAATTNLLADGRVIVTGGLIGGHPVAATDAVEIWDPATGTWSTAAPLPDRRSRHKAVVLDDGRLLVAGGLVELPDGSGRPTTSTLLYDPTLGTWSTVGSLHVARDNFQLTLLGNSRVLASGGITDSTVVVTNSSEVFDPNTMTWTLVGQMHNARFMHRATLMGNGRVLVTGGSLAGHCNAKTTAEIFDPSTGTWTMTAPMSSGRTTHLSVRLDDGRVLVAGGWSNPVATCNRDGALESASAEAEIFDPVTERWTPTGSLNVARAGSGVYELLLDGRVLYAGGRTPNPGQGTDRTTTTELYDPVTGTWSLDAPMSSPHGGGSSELLNDGRVMAVAGGTQFKLAEVFTP